MIIKNKVILALTITLLCIVLGIYIFHDQQKKQGVSGWPTRDISTVRMFQHKLEHKQVPVEKEKDIARAIEVLSNKTIDSDVIALIAHVMILPSNPAPHFVVKDCPTLAFTLIDESNRVCSVLYKKNPDSDTFYKGIFRISEYDNLFGQQNNSYEFYRVYLKHFGEKGEPVGNRLLKLQKAHQSGIAILEGN